MAASRGESRAEKVLDVGVKEEGWLSSRDVGTSELRRGGSPRVGESELAAGNDISLRSLVTLPQKAGKMVLGHKKEHEIVMLLHIAESLRNRSRRGRKFHFLQSGTRYDLSLSGRCRVERPVESKPRVFMLNRAVAIRILRSSPCQYSEVLARLCGGGLPWFSVMVVINAAFSFACSVVNLPAIAVHSKQTSCGLHDAFPLVPRAKQMHAASAQVSTDTPTGLKKNTR